MWKIRRHGVCSLVRDDHQPQETNEEEKKHDATCNDRNHETAHSEDTEASHYSL